jgi:hypothetical protein
MCNFCVRYSNTTDATTVFAICPRATYSRASLAKWLHGFRPGVDRFGEHENEASVNVCIGLTSARFRSSV